MPGPAGAGPAGAGQLAFDLFRGPCPNTSCGQGCRYYADHDPVPCTFGGGLCDPISARHCDHNRGHEPHAWPPDRPEYACSGAQLPNFCADDQRIHLPHDNCPGRDHKQCDRTLAEELHDAHSFEDPRRAWFCLGLRSG